MRLQKVWISEYKNLKNFTLDFDGNSFIDVFVGKNGTGKSNLFEALIEIFRHLYEFDKDKNSISFKYSISYDLNNKRVSIEWQEGKLLIDGEERKTANKSFLPDNVLVYYSGHNDTISNLVKTYQEKFSKRIKKADFDESRRFIGIGSEYKGLLLTIMLMQKEDCKACRYICQKLEIKPETPTIKISLKRPIFAKKKELIDDFEPKTHFWGTEGITKQFLDRLLKCIKGEFKHTDIYTHNRDAYSFEINTSLYRTTIAADTDITEQFSDGQFQAIYIYSIVEIFKERNCITLLDELDAFLHPEWQYDFLKQVFEITDTASKSNHILMSSHSAVTLIPHDRKKIKFFDIKDNYVNCYDLPKHIAINKLSADIIHYSEHEQLCKHYQYNTN